MKIFTGLDRANELNFPSYRLFVEFLASRLNRRIDWKAVDAAHPIRAIVDYGRWLAECECGESYYVEPTDPLGYCVTCGNRVVEGMNGKVRPVIFPANRLTIEAALLERELVGDAGTIQRLGTQAVLFPKIVHPKELPRHWDGQTVDQLRAEHRKVKEIMNSMKEQRGS